MPASKKYPPSGCFGERVDRLLRAMGWSDKKACQEFGYGYTNDCSPVERVRRGGHAAAQFVIRLVELERQHAQRLALLDAPSNKKLDIGRLKLRARQMRSRDFAAMGQAGTVPAQGRAASGDGRKLQEVVLVSRSGRVIARKSTEDWVARHAPARIDPPDDGWQVKGKR